MDTIEISKIKPAAYNPRFLSEQAFQELQSSINTLGFILPIIVNKDNMTIVAGHQRTKVCTKLGITSVPCCYISNVSTLEEIAYNQIHNGVEMEPKVKGKATVELQPGFFENFDSEKFIISNYQTSVVNKICGLLVKHGNPLYAIICNSTVVFGNNYIKAAQMLGITVNISVVESGKYDLLNYFLFRDYGCFCYDNIEREDFVQGLAQPNRNKSIEYPPLYRTMNNYLFKEKKTVNILDFGCGKGDYIRKLKIKDGYSNSIGLEFFNHNRKGIDVKIGHVMIDRFIDFVKKHGKFDYVICNAVINSVNTQHAEDSVLACLSLFCKPGGRIFVSGRSRDYIESRKENTKTLRGINEDYIKFFDNNGLTSIMREGKWFFQKFLYQRQIDQIISRFDEKPFVSYHKNYFGFGVFNAKQRTKEEYIDAVNYEFNLKLPNGQSFNRQNEILDLFGLNQ